MVYHLFCRQFMDSMQRQFFAIYNADGSLSGEIRYLLGKLSGASECALCELSHGWNPLGREVWRQSKEALSQLVWLHRDEQPDALRAFSEGLLPAVIMEEASGFKILMDAACLRTCAGDFKVFEQEFLARVGALIGDSMALEGPNQTREFDE